ncbi:uncharacterized protein [Argopecten irradians]|uniref:uncharacterized protein n=1 Tax=Argopecten irradians TaxID=31199 RepID=UPI003716DF18
MAAILGSQKIVKEFDFVGEILNNMEPRPSEKSSRKSEKLSKSKAVPSNSATVKSMTKSTLESEPTLTKTMEVDPQDCESQDKSASDRASPEAESAQINNDLSTTMAMFMGNMQNLMQQQMRIFQMLPFDNGGHDSQEYHDQVSDDESDMDVCDKIDEILRNDVIQTSSATDKAGSAENSSNDDLPDYLTKTAKEITADEPTGPEIKNDKLANLITDMLSKRMSVDKIKAKMSDYPRPANIKMIVAPRCNSTIYRSLNQHIKQRDVSFQQMQKRLVSGLTPLARALERLTEMRKTESSSRAEIDELLKLILDGFLLVANASQLFSQRRRELIKPDLNKHFANLCSVSNLVTTELFRNELSQAVRDISETNKLSHSVSKFAYSNIKGASRYSNKGKAGWRPYNNKPYDRPYFNHRGSSGGNYRKQGNGGQSHFHKNKPKNSKKGQERK